MTIHPLITPKELPYTKSTNEVNYEKKILIQCNYCKYSIVINFIPSPMCGMCHHEMISVIPDSNFNE